MCPLMPSRPFCLGAGDPLGAVVLLPGEDVQIGAGVVYSNTKMRRHVSQ